MIGKLTGIIDSLGEDWVLVEVGGVGYLVYCSSRLLGALPQPGSAVSLYIETHVREDVIRLYGFRSVVEKAWFLHLQSVQGVGARVALAILDVLALSDMQNAVALQDKSAFARANGVGPKLAARIVAELKGRAPPAGAIGQSADEGAFTGPFSDSRSADERIEGLKDMILRNDAISALVNLGYNEVNAAQAVMRAYSGFDEDPPMDVLIKVALKEISH